MKIKRHIYAASIAVTVFIFGFVFYQLLFVEHEPFPTLANGKYIGFFPGSIITSQEKNIYFSVESEPNSSLLRFVIYHSSWGLNHIEFRNIKDEGKSNEPLIFSGPEGILRFGGRSVSDSYISGKVTNVSFGQSAEWVLFASPDKPSSGFEDSIESKILAFKAEQGNLLMQIDSQKQLLETSDKELARVTQVLTQGNTLQQKAESRFSEKQSQIENLKLQISKAEEDLSKMQSALTVQRSITQLGRLTTIARESLSKEYREIDYKLSGDAHRNDSALIEELAAAQEALAIKRELENSGVYDKANISKGLEIN